MLYNYTLVTLSRTCDKRDYWKTTNKFSRLGYSQLNYIKYHWVVFMITFITCIIKLSNLFKIAMQLWGLCYKNRRNSFEEKHATLVLETGTSIALCNKLTCRSQISYNKVKLLLERFFHRIRRGPGNETLKKRKKRTAFYDRFQPFAGCGKNLISS